ncbi:FAD-dependent oxidoreductase [Desulfosporosinus fructosivorans]
MKKNESDVIVVGGGPAGLSAAIAAAEAGAKVVVFEKTNTTGGAGNMGMGPLGIETRIQREQLIDITREEAFNMFMEYTHYRVDARLVQTYLDKSADTIQWLEDMGVEFIGAFKYFSGSEQTWHIVKPPSGIPGPRAASTMFKIMTERAQELGVEFHLETSVKKLMIEDGKIVGAIAEDKNGEQIEARGKAVTVNTGGFGDNPEMIKKFTGFEVGKDFFPFRVPGVVGEGLKMCWEVGATQSDINVEMIYQIPDNINWFVLDGVMRQPNLLVNQRGERFMNEYQLENTTFAGNAIARQPGKFAYVIMDEAIKKNYQKNGLDLVSVVHSAHIIDGFDFESQRAVDSKYPYFFVADSIEELAEQIGIDTDALVGTVDEYNEMCEVHNDSMFHKQQRYLRPIGKGKIYAAKFFPAAYGSLGGIKINYKGEVLNDNDEKIEGLYGAGTDACTIYGDSYCFYLPGNTMGFALNSGRIVGENAADFALGM